MGVLGLAPFIQKTIPEVIQTLPNRLRSLGGKTVVIDGTLITQRLHFAPMPHSHRHVLGWYRIMKELQECNVQAICVFDGKQRSLAKDIEMERRRSVRKMTAARGVLEVERLRRLHRLTSLLHMWRRLEGPKREQATEALRTLVYNTKHLSKAYGSPLQLVRNTMDSAYKEAYRPDIPPWHAVSPQEAMGDFEDSDIIDVLLGHASMPLHASQDSGSGSGSDSYTAHEEHDIPLAHNAHDAPFENTHSPELQANAQDTIAFEALMMPDSTYDPLPLTKDLSSSLTSLYLQYRHSIPQLTSLPNSAPQSSVADVRETVTDEPVVHEVQTEYAMSKTQYQLMAEEGALWDGLAKSALSELAADAAEAAVAILVQKSSLLSESYTRRTHPPTSETYLESKEILRAMGVPCIESTGRFEAEALAASLVLHGYADYVASEDTDVLVYEAPLIRNIASRAGPLVIISGADVRGVLQLDRARFVDFALLLGTDFSPRIKNVGPARALRFIRAHGSIERVLEAEPQYPPRVPPEAYLAQVGLARLVFETLPPTPDVDLLRQKDYDEKEVTRVLRKYRLLRATMHDWNYGAALSGNYFHDDPAAS
ncbi:hypothetical protein AcW1_009585 [Taiwanofungus camphoratus]|nr:hypothetical protein AcW1_009585 [Antrodia cinnamomea]